jgi:D-serine dehydratase
MREYCDRHGALLAPHGKTSMAPQLLVRQLEHGAWALTAATPTQVATMRRFGFTRIILANELTDAPSLSWISGQLDEDEDFDFYCLVDSAAATQQMERLLADADARRPVQVLLEVGVPGGRCGVRNRADALEVARAVRAASHLALAGVEAYEGLVTGGDAPSDIAALDEFLQLVRAVAIDLDAHELFDAEPFVTAGGSSYFDRVVANLSGIHRISDAPMPLVLRSGCYISHDTGKYEKLSPLARRAAAGEELRLVNAMTAWGRVLSIPEPGTVIVGLGKRDAAHDLTLPSPREVFRADGTRHDLRGTAETYKLMDQHAFLRVDTALDICPGEVVSFDMSHPCTAFDKARLIPLIDADHNVVDAVLTFF